MNVTTLFIKKTFTLVDDALSFARNRAALTVYNSMIGMRQLFDKRVAFRGHHIAPYLKIKLSDIIPEWKHDDSMQIRFGSIDVCEEYATFSVQKGGVEYKFKVLEATDVVTKES